MRNKWVVLLIILVVFLGAMPYMTGLLLKNQVDKLIAEAPLPSSVTLKVQDYTVGYLQSSYTLLVNILDSSETLVSIEDPNHEIEFLAHINIHHGPLLQTNQGLSLGVAYAHGFIGLDDVNLLDDETKKKIASYIDGTEVIATDATLGFSGFWDVDFYSTKVDFDDPDGTIQWGGFSGEMRYATGLHKPHNKVGILISPILLQTKSERPAIVDSAEIKLFSDTSMAKDKLWVGSQVLQVPSFYLRDEHGNEIRFDRLQVTTKSDIERDLAAAQVKANAQNIVFFSQKINSLNFSVNIDKLDAKSLGEFSKISKTSSSNMTSTDRQALTSALIGMLCPGAEFHVNHLMKMDEGDMTAKIEVKFPDLLKEHMEEAPEIVAQKLVTKLNATISLDMPNHWLQDILYRAALTRLPENAPPHKDPKTGVVISAQDALKNDISAQLKTLSDQRVLVNNGKQSSLLLAYHEGALSLNGTALSQEAIQKILAELKPNESVPK